MDTDTEDTDTKLENMGKQDQQESEMPVASTSVKPVTQVDRMGTDTETDEIETDSESMDTDTEDTDTNLENMGQQESEMPVASTFHCTYPGCARQFKREVWCFRHVDKHFQNNVCPTCNKKVSSKSSLARHIQLHKDKRNTYTCVTCNRKFYYKSDLNYHVKTVHNEKNLYKCSMCDKEYSTKKLLNNHHQAVHLKLKKYRCPECGLFFGQSIELHRHRKKNHVVES
ncbi:gastrula zinc finger protein XlCGF7.1-like [Acyrthosiphon pisum]|uniref:C2H2-type domain-containing protein n=1 Tax=Acyrthosiphon pisum TaxID=7029 RepID=A0A8R2F7R9_ACYPI|nr:gastrula zinc finger protein XlCGF7.1-like [Acyrthosiphon pisum]|eukprot:XP_008182460.1 PREDICTED: gastrula zinc finger protein XlCGF7.1-like [Acyrthosiphon pisum]